MDQRQSTTTTVGVFRGAAVSQSTDFFRPVVTTLPHWPEQPSASQQAYASSHNDMTKSDQDNQSVHSGDHYDSFSGSGQGEDTMGFPITPPVADHIPNGSLNHEPDIDGEPPSKRQRISVPEGKKDGKYWDRRKKNNQAAKRSRDTRKKRIEDEIKSAKEAISENQKLKQEIDVLKAEINSLRRLLKDANITLSLWIKARQASEPNSQLPPMLRGPNLSFVNFPVATTI